MDGKRNISSNLDKKYLTYPPPPPPLSSLVAVKLVGECIVHDGERAAGAILYNPEVRLVGSHRNERIVGGGPARPSNSTFYYTNSSAFTPRSAAAAGGNGRPISGNYGNPSRNHHNNNNNQHHHQQHNSNNNNNNTDSTVNTATNANINSADYETRSVPIPAAMVGCIIGRRGIFINQIRMESGSRISISKTTDPVTSQRIFTVMGTPESNEKALAMLYKQLDSERERFNEAGEQAGGDQDGEVVDEE